MRISAKIASLALSGVMVLGMAGAAFAAPAVATGTVNVRSGPSTNYQRIDSLVRGQQVDVRECQGRWCYVTKSGPDGWVSANYLQQGRPQQTRPQYPAAKPSVTFSFNFGTVQRPRNPGGNHPGQGHNNNGGGNGGGNHDGGGHHGGGHNGGGWQGGNNGGWNND